MPEKDIGQIIEGCRKAEEASYSQLVDIYSSRMYGYFYRLTGSRDVSDELLSELFVKLVEKIGQYRGGSFDSWLFRVASNLFYDHLREKHRQQALIEEHVKILEEKDRPPVKGDGGEQVRPAAKAARKIR